MKILIDTDILLDVALNRAPFAEASGQILDWAESHPGSACVAWHTLANVAYLVKGNPRAFLRELLAFVIVPNTSTDVARQALELPIADLEDAFQAVTAQAFGADHILTRNLKHYRRSPISALAPEQFLNELA
jgi:predicted nucleic acid-binding protein